MTPVGFGNQFWSWKDKPPGDMEPTPIDVDVERPVRVPWWLVVGIGIDATIGLAFLIKNVILPVFQ